MPSILSFQFMTNPTFLQVIENDLGLRNITATQDWLKENKKSIELKLEEQGAILFKDLPIGTAEDFDQFVSTFNYDTFTYEESLSNAVRINKTNKVNISSLPNIIANDKIPLPADDSEPYVCATSPRPGPKLFKQAPIAENAD